MDDDTYLTDLLRYALTREGYAVQVAVGGAQALKLAAQAPPDAALLDVNLPDTTGYELCDRLQRHLHIPVILLTARGSDEDTLTGFARGADDYVANRSACRCCCVGCTRCCDARRLGPSRSTRRVPLYRIGTSSFNAEQNHLSSASQGAKLAATEGRLLRLLLTHEGQVFSADRMIELLWDYDTETSDGAVKRTSTIGTKLAAVLGDVSVIYTVPGMGYTIRLPEERGEPASHHDQAG